MDEDTRDAINEAIDDAVSDGEGRATAEHLAHHLQKRGLCIVPVGQSTQDIIRRLDAVTARNGNRCSLWIANTGAFPGLGDFAVNIGCFRFDSHSVEEALCLAEQWAASQFTTEEVGRTLGVLPAEAA